MSAFFKEAWELLKQTASEWSSDRAPTLGAAMAFYSILSLAPLLVIAIAVAGAFFGEEAARGQIVREIGGLVGTQGAEAVEEMLAHSRKPEAGILATVLGVATLLIGAGGVFGQLQDALNVIWDVERKPGRGIKGFLLDRFISFAMVLGTGFLLLVSLVISAVLAAMGAYMTGLAPGLAGVLVVVNAVVSFALIMVLFAMIFKLIPDAVIAWKDVWIGAAITTTLFLLGKFLLGLYLGRASVGSPYGAAGSLVVLVVWVYYSAQIVFFGAEFTQVYAGRRGRAIVPKPGAQRIDGSAEGEPAPRDKARPEKRPAKSVNSPITRPVSGSSL